jgi:hypothetical protein
VYGLWPTAVEQGRIAGLNSVGGDEFYRDTVVPATILKVTGADLSSVGQFELGGDDVTVIVEEDPTAGRYRKLVVSGGEAVGAILIGYPAEAQAIVDAVRERRQLASADLERLRSGDWSPLLDGAPGRSGRAAFQPHDRSRPSSSTAPSRSPSRGALRAGTSSTQSADRRARRSGRRR